jgi:PAS domain S-box-containing protein
MTFMDKKQVGATALQAEVRLGGEPHLGLAAQSHSHSGGEGGAFTALVASEFSSAQDELLGAPTAFESEILLDDSALQGEQDLMGGLVDEDSTAVFNRAEDFLRESESRLRRIADNLPVLVWMAHPDGTRFYVNQAWSTFCGGNVEAGFARAWVGCVHSDDREYCLSRYKSAFAARQAYSAEYRLRRFDGEYCWYFETAVPRYDELGNFLGYIGCCFDINERKRLEDDMRKQIEPQGWLSNIAATVPGMIFSFRQPPAGIRCMPYASSAIEEVFGLRPEEVRSDASPALSLIHPDDLASIERQIEDSARQMTPWRAEFRVVHPRKGEIWVEGHAMPQLEGDGAVLWHGFVQEITERKRMEGARRANEAELNRAQALAQIGSWRFDVQRSEMTWSDVSQELFGVPKGDPLSHEAFLALVHLEDRAFVASSWRAALQGEPYDIEHRILVGGQVRWVRERAEFESNAQGLHLAYGTTQDITERKLAESALAASETRYRLAMQALAGVVYDWDLRTDVIGWSSGLSRLCGVPIEDSEPTRRWWRMRVHPQDLQRTRAAVVRAMRAKNGDFEVEYRIRHSDGHWVHVADRAHIVRNATGVPVRWVGSLTDISARKDAESALHRINDTLEAQVLERSAEAEARARALAESERFARATIDALNSTLCVLDEDGRIIAVNKAWREFAAANSAWTESVSEGADYLATCDAVARQSCPAAADVAAVIRRVMAGEQQSCSVEYDSHAQDERRWFMTTVSRFPGNGPLRVVVTHDNVTERKMAVEKQRETAERFKRLASHLETVREEQSTMIAREIHDELGGTLTMLKLGLVTMVDGGVSVGDGVNAAPLYEKLKGMLDQVDVALQTVKRISSSLRPAMLDALGLIATVKWHAAEFSRLTGVATELDLPKYIRLSPERSTAIFRIIQEALTNVAKHANAGRATIAMRKEAGRLIVEVSDNGVGLKDGCLHKINSFGVIGMNERAQYLGGDLALAAPPEGPTKLILNIPLEG